MPCSRHSLLTNVHSVISRAEIVVSLRSRAVMDMEYEDACIRLMEAMITEGDQLTNALAFSILAENGVSFSVLSKHVSNDAFKALSRSIQPVIRCAIETENMEQQMLRIKMYRDLFMTETR